MESFENVEITGDFASRFFEWLISMSLTSSKSLHVVYASVVPSTSDVQSCSPFWWWLSRIAFT